MSPKIYIVVCALLSLILIGCGGSSEIRGQLPQIVQQKASISTPENKLSELLIKSALTHGAKPSDDYVIGPEDLLEIEVFEANELKRKARVSSQGYIGFPLIGQVKASGLTPIQLEKEIATKLDKYMKEPTVTVYVAEYKARKIAVIGSVDKPQVYSVTGQKYLLDMLSMAGGLTKEAGNICYVIRPVNEEGGFSKNETIVVDLKELLISGNVALNIPVFNGDVINVPKGGMVFVDGAIEKPGAFPMQHNTTLLQAIAMAGGLKFEADKSDVRIFRDKGDGSRDIISVDYEAIKEGVKEDVFIKDNDIIIVPKSGIKNFFSGFYNAIRGLISFGKAL